MQILRFDVGFSTLFEKDKSSMHSSIGHLLDDRRETSTCYQSIKDDDTVRVQKKHDEV
jgi:hypothetical protein